MQATTTTRNHHDGGTYEIIAAKFRANGWGVAITRWTTYRGTVVFEVCRCSSDDRMIRMATKTTEKDARAAANAIWVRDRV